ncbi:sugar transferase [Bradyrhizobium sp. DASA03120]|uniref:sugar transferase n=1 Tax=Bradyrhizobium sp. SMVTL-02 TaxID=3395917 RepID=UPI003F71EB13
MKVLKSDMSLMGSRPHAVAHNVEYERIISNFALRHYLKPGMTGWAQVSGYRRETRTIDLMRKRA